MPNAWSHYATAKAFAGGLNYSGDDVRLALMGSGYSPTAPLTSQWWSDVVASELANGNGYTTNGLTIASKTLAVTEANSWAASWAATTAYTTGQIIKPQAAQNNGHLYRALSTGSSGGSQPTWPTASGATVVDSGVTWEEVGSGILVVSSAAPVFSGLTATGIRYGWLYDRTPATDASRPLIGLVDFGSGQNWTNTNVTVSPDATLGWLYHTPA